MSLRNLAKKKIIIKHVLKNKIKISKLQINPNKENNSDKIVFQTENKLSWLMKKDNTKSKF